MKIALIMPHIYMWDKILKDSIFAPGHLAIDLADSLTQKGHKVTLFSTGPVRTKACVISLDLKSIKKELAKYDQNLSDLIKNDLPKFRQFLKIIELEILANVYKVEKEFDLIHVFITNGPEGPIFSKVIKKPIIFTLHDPFKLNFPNPESYKLIKDVKFTAISNSQKSFVTNLNVTATVYNGINFAKFKFKAKSKNYFAYLGRIITPKGVHHAINVCLKTKSNLEIAGLHYEGHGKDHYWSRKVEPHIKHKLINYQGFIKKQQAKCEFLGNAKALLFPIKWEEPFGMTLIEANACGTPVIAFSRGSVPEIIKDGVNGFIVKNEAEMVKAMGRIDEIDRKKCREYAESNFSLEKMVDGYEKVYKELKRQ
jgi:glycosyltransferase involved in cell wall biosynthesis